jgi:acetylornithine deacetylase
VEDRILRKVDEKKNAIVELLRTLIRIPSLTGEEGEAQAFLAGCLRELGMKVDAWEPDIEEIFKRFPEQAQYPTHWQHDLILPYERTASYAELIRSGKIEVLNYKNRPNLVGWLKGLGGGRSLLFNGHIDNVTVEPRTDWSHDPFGAEIVDGRIYGRGASDMKGGMAASLAATQCLIEAGVPLRGDVIYSSVVNEEHSGNGMLSLMCKGVRADAAIVNEPSENRIYVATPGDVYWELTIDGVARSPGARWEGRELVGVSAIDKLPLVIQSLLKLEADYNTKTPDPLYGSKNAFSCVIGEIRGGTYSTVTATQCVVRGCMYFGHGFGTVNEIMDSIKEYIARGTQSDSWFRKHPVKTVFLHHRDSCKSDVDHPLVEIVRKTAERVSGQNTPIIGSPYCTDMDHTVNLGKIPTIIYGPGSIACAHKADEWIDIDQYLEAVKSLAVATYRWCR